MKLAIENDTNEPVLELRLVNEDGEIVVETTDDEGAVWQLVVFKINDKGKLVYYTAGFVGDSRVETISGQNIREVNEFEQ